MVREKRKEGEEEGRFYIILSIPEKEG